MITAAKYFHGEKIPGAKGLLNPAENGRTRTSSRKLKPDSFQLEIKRRFFTGWVINHWNNPCKGEGWLLRPFKSPNPDGLPFWEVGLATHKPLGSGQRTGGPSLACDRQGVRPWNLQLPPPPQICPKGLRPLATRGCWEGKCIMGALLLWYEEGVPSG